MSGIDIFLSYSREDRAAVRHIAESFAAEGLDVWWDAALQSGQTFDEVIEQRLKEAKAVVVLWSPRSVTSRWVRAEATLADRKNKLVPAIIEPCDRPIAFELTHTADLSEWTGDTTDPRWRAFVNDVEALVHKSRGVDGPEPAPKTTQVSMHRRPDRVAPAAREQARSSNDDVVFTATTHKHSRQPIAPPPTAPEPMASEVADEDVHILRITDGIDDEQLFIVEQEGLKIGRTAPADAVIAHPSVSRQHCMVGIANDELLVSDLNSTNGTYIDDQRVGRPALLPVGSVLRVGQVSLSHEVLSRAEASRWTPGSGRRGGMRPARLATAP